MSRMKKMTSLVVALTLTGAIGLSVTGCAQQAQLPESARQYSTEMNAASQGDARLQGDTARTSVEWTDQQEIAAREAAAAQAAAEAAAQAAAAQAAADAAAQQSAAEESNPDTSTSSDDDGTPVPWVDQSSDPNNVGGGYFDTTQCPSGSASTVNGVPTCD